jgi:hypothetical protein
VGRSVKGVGKRVDALLRTAGIIRSLAFAEIKHHRTQLVEDEYRVGCWGPRGKSQVLSSKHSRLSIWHATTSVNTSKTLRPTERCFHRQHSCSARGPSLSWEPWTSSPVLLAAGCPTSFGASSCSDEISMSQKSLRSTSYWSVPSGTSNHRHKHRQLAPITKPWALRRLLPRTPTATTLTLLQRPPPTRGVGQPTLRGEWVRSTSIVRTSFTSRRVGFECRCEAGPQRRQRRHQRRGSRCERGCCATPLVRESS